MRPLIEHGHVYIAKPPLFRLDIGRQKFFALDEKELAVLQKQHPGGEVARFKGLGEMKSEELAVTAMNPETRSIIRVTIDSLGEAETLFSSLMGVSVEPKRAYLETHQTDAYDDSYEMS
jgi:DNA gyrase/topoisomerase IV subunit B